MKKKSRTEITVETDEVRILRRRRRGVRAHCPQCGEPVRMLTLEEAVALAGVNSRAIYRWVEAGRLHFTETPDGLLLICLNSLP